MEQMCETGRAARRSAAFRDSRRDHSPNDIVPIIFEELFGEHRYLVSRALWRAGGISELDFLEHCYPLAMATRSVRRR